MLSLIASSISSSSWVDGVFTLAFFPRELALASFIGRQEAKHVPHYTRKLAAHPGLRASPQLARGLGSVSENIGHARHLGVLAVEQRQRELMHIFGGP